MHKFKMFPDRVVPTGNLFFMVNLILSSSQVNPTLSVLIFTDRLPTKNENLMKNYETSPKSTYFQKVLTLVQGTRLRWENLILTNLVPIILIRYCPGKVFIQAFCCYYVPQLFIYLPTSPIIGGTKWTSLGKRNQRKRM